MKFTITLLVLLLGSSLFAQDQQKLTYDTKKAAFIVPDEFVFDFVKGVELKFTECEAEDKFVIEVGAPPVKTAEIACGSSLQWKPTKPADKLTAAVVKNGKKVSTFMLSKDGKISDQKVLEDPDKPVLVVLPTSDIQFVKPEYLMSTANPGGKVLPKNRLEYNPCANNWTLKRGNVETSKLDYSLIKDEGLSFIISPINTLKYDITVAKSFVFTEAEVPDLFTQLYGQFTKFSGQQGGANSRVVPLNQELGKIMKLNTDLKKFLSAKTNSIDCGEMAKFAEQKAAILEVIEPHFPDWDIAKAYNGYKKTFMGHVPNGVVGDEAKYNDAVKKKFTMEVTPDALVTETVKLVNTLIQTSFRYQYNVPQIKNAEELVFDLTLKPKEGSNGGIYMDKEQFRLPIYNNWSIEASTGFYYTDATNAQFSLRNDHLEIPGNDPVINLDSLVSKTIVQDRGTAAGSIGAPGL